MGRRKFSGEEQCDPLKMGLREKVRLQEMVCYKTGENSEESDLEKKV